MNKASQEATETKTLLISDDNISQADYESLRNGKTVEVDKSAPEVEKPTGETDDDSEASKLDAKDTGDDEEFDGDEPDDEASADPVKPKKKSGTQRRIEKLVKQRAAAESEREYWRQEALRAQAGNQPPVPEAKVMAEGRPTANDFETHEDYIVALAEWKADEKISAARASDRQEQLKTENDSKTTAFKEKVKEFRKTRDDFEDVIADVDDIAMPLAVSQAVLESDNGPELMYELAKDREEYERICSLPSLAAARAIGRFEAKLSFATEEKIIATKQKQTTKAPAPARPISASTANGKKTIRDDNISQAEYESLRNEQDRRRRGV